MSSVFETLMTSDNAHSTGPAPAQGPRQVNRDGRVNQQAAVSRGRYSSRPRGPPSESAGAMSDVEGYLDEETATAQAARRKRGPTRRNDVVRHVDTIGENLARSFEAFLENFIDEPTSSGGPVSSAGTATTDKYYIAQVHGLRAYNLSTFYVDFTHLLKYEQGVMAGAIAEQYYRFLPFITRALNNTIAKYEPRYYREHRQPGSTTSGTESSVAANATSQSSSMAEKTLNQQTDKMFTLAFYNLPVVSRVRQLRTDEIGKLCSITGTVTRTSEVRPELFSGTFICEVCNNVVYNLEQTFRYTEPTQCPNETCNNQDKWRLDIRQSTFVDWQRIRVQESSAEIPTGSMPRTMDVIVRGEIVDRAKAGEKCVFTGTLIVVPDISQFRVPGVHGTPQVMKDGKNLTRGSEGGGGGVSGLKALGVRDLTYRMAFLACMVTPDLMAAGQPGSRHLTGQANNILASLHQTSSLDPYESGEEAQQEYLASLSPAEIEDLRQMVHKPNIYMRLVDSLAPMVYGHEVVKKGLLLQLMGGVSKMTPEGMALRGDINVCVVGDPSTSKSQFLKYICSLVPRAVYTSGKASSAAGLTAAVVKDEETGDHTIEAGALMLADNGICAIDEFDKMDITDQVAIHEAMEQQTISIAKAGIQATLNARTSILAAANPVGGRYNRKATLRANINMSAPIMSRFDLFFIILDECEESVDRHLAQHIVNVHRLRDDAVQPEFSTEQLQRYIRFARTFKPEFTPEAKTMLVAKYKELRADDAQGGIGRNSYRITVRQLESMIRLSEAIAKANCVTDVTEDFVKEAFKLLRQSIISVEKDDVEFEEDEDSMVVGGAQDNGDEEEGETMAAREESIDNGERGEAPLATAERTKITWDKYRSIVNMMIKRVNEDEAQNGEGVEEQELLLWYLEEKEEELSSQDDLDREGELARKVLKRMVKDNIFMAIRGEGLADEDGEGMRHEERVTYVVHPNYAVDDAL